MITIGYDPTRGLLIHGSQRIELPEDERRTVNIWLFGSSEGSGSHACDTADCCEAKPYVSLDDLLSATVGPLHEQIRKLEEEADYLRGRSEHFREMLALKNGALVKARTEIERLERLLGQLVAKTSNSGLFADPAGDCPKLREGFDGLGWAFHSLDKKEGR